MRPHQWEQFLDWQAGGDRRTRAAQEAFGIRVRLGEGFLTWVRERGAGMSPRGFGARDWRLTGGGDARAGDFPAPRPESRNATR